MVGGEQALASLEASIVQNISRIYAQDSLMAPNKEITKSII